MIKTSPEWILKYISDHSPETLILVHDKAWDNPKDVADSFSHHNAESCGTQGLIAVATHKILVGFDKDEVPKSSLERRPFIWRRLRKS
jgi:hypothetical protein